MNSEVTAKGSYVHSLQQEIIKYREYVKRNECQYNRQLNEMKIKLAEKDFELSNLKEVIKDQEIEINKLTKTISVLFEEEIRLTQQEEEDTQKEE